MTYIFYWGKDYEKRLSSCNRHRERLVVYSSYRLACNYQHTLTIKLGPFGPFTLSGSATSRKRLGDTVCARCMSDIGWG